MSETPEEAAERARKIAAIMAELKRKLSAETVKDLDVSLAELERLYVLGSPLSRGETDG